MDQKLLDETLVALKKKALGSNITISNDQVLAMVELDKQQLLKNVSVSYGEDGTPHIQMWNSDCLSDAGHLRAEALIK